MMKADYDERQKQRRDRIGSQSFVLLVILTLANIFAYYLGLRWLDFPVSTMILVLVCCGVYKIRVVLSGAFVAPGTGAATAWRRAIGVVVVAAAGALAAVAYFTRGAEFSQDTGPDALALLAVSAGLLVAILVVSLVRKRKDREKDE
jgi:hypothetical protein